MGTDSLATGYDPLTGALASVRDGMGEVFTYTYDNAQRLSTVTHLVGTANVAVETRSYDDESRVIRRAMTRGATALVADTLHHDTRSKLLAATGLVPTRARCTRASCTPRRARSSPTTLAARRATRTSPTSSGTRGRR